MKFKTLILILGFAFLATACGQEMDEDALADAETLSAQALDVGPFAKYVKAFEDASVDYGDPVRVRNLVIRFGHLDNPFHSGMCVIRSGATPEIIINEKNWNVMSEAKREGLLMHEMGHCVLERNHDDEEDSDGNPLSIMNPYTLDGEYYSDNRDDLLSELFDLASADTFR